jgi:plasmid stabilization system protein ParE
MDLIFHPQAVKDTRGIASRYQAVSEELAERFWLELDSALESIHAYPERHHYDPSGFRRANLDKFPSHVLFEIRLECIRVMVIRHHHRNPTFGLRRK